MSVLDALGLFSDRAYDDVLGYVAGSLVLATFAMRSLRALRAVAILSNVAFVLYALRVDLTPVLVLHSVLMPLNLVRLAQLAAEGRKEAMTAPRIGVPGEFGRWSADARASAKPAIDA